MGCSEAAADAAAAGAAADAAAGAAGLGWAASESLLSELLEFAVAAPERVYQHSWEVGDLAVWGARRPPSLPCCV